MATRAATHAGSWYSDDQGELTAQLNGWLAAAAAGEAPQRARIVIGPHAGYRFCGLTEAHAYTAIAPDTSLVYVLGPSHHKHFEGCRVSGFSSCETPLGTVAVDTAAAAELGLPQLSAETDEEEHSVEMHLPFVRRVAPRAAVVPILVGSVTQDSAAAVAATLARRLQRDPSAAIAISSDFCHWGARFGYTYMNNEWAGGQGVWRSVERLDRLGCEEISSGSPERFAQYLAQYRNTICGRNAILVALHAAQQAGQRFDIKLVHYSQSNKAQTPRDSSVSYAAMHFTPA